MMRPGSLVFIHTDGMPERDNCSPTGMGLETHSASRGLPPSSHWLVRPELHTSAVGDLNERYLALEVAGLKTRCIELAVQPDSQYHEAH